MSGNKDHSSINNDNRKPKYSNDNINIDKDRSFSRKRNTTKNYSLNKSEYFEVISKRNKRIKSANYNTINTEISNVNIVNNQNSSDKTQYCIIKENFIRSELFVDKNEFNNIYKVRETDNKRKAITTEEVNWYIKKKSSVTEDSSNSIFNNNNLNNNNNNNNNEIDEKKRSSYNNANTELMDNLTITKTQNPDIIDKIDKRYIEDKAEIITIDEIQEEKKYPLNPQNSLINSLLESNFNPNSSLSHTVKNTDKPNIPELEQNYDLVFIGGGPSTLSFLTYIFQYDLQKLVFNGTRILVIEKSDQFGSGCLGKYGIRTNTSAEGFLKLLFKNVPKQSYHTRLENNENNSNNNNPHNNKRRTSHDNFKIDNNTNNNINYFYKDYKRVKMHVSKKPHAFSISKKIDRNTQKKSFDNSNSNNKKENKVNLKNKNFNSDNEESNSNNLNLALSKEHTSKNFDKESNNNLSKMDSSKNFDLIDTKNTESNNRSNSINTAIIHKQNTTSITSIGDTNAQMANNITTTTSTTNTPKSCSNNNNRKQFSNISYNISNNLSVSTDDSNTNMLNSNNSNPSNNINTNKNNNNNLIDIIQEEDEEFKDLNFECFDKERQRNDVIPEFLPLYDHLISNQLKKLGNNPSPLVLVGEFLNLLGLFIVEIVKEKFSKNILLLNSEAISIKRVSNQEIKIVINTKKNFTSTTLCDNVNNNSKNLFRTITTRKVIMATGGTPKVSRELENNIWKSIVSNNKLIKEYLEIEKEKSKLNNQLTAVPSINNNSNNINNNTTPNEILSSNTNTTNTPNNANSTTNTNTITTKNSISNIHNNPYVKFLHADNFLSEKGFISVLDFIYNHLKKLFNNQIKLSSDKLDKENTKTESTVDYQLLIDEDKEKHKIEMKRMKINIIGGSHSSFSCAWILINGPAQCGLKNHFNKDCISETTFSKCNEIIINDKQISSPCLTWKEALLHPLYDFLEENYSRINVIENSVKTNINNNLKTSQSISTNCIQVTNTNSRNKYDLSKIISLTILHKSNIKVSYQSQEEASKDNYINYDFKSLNAKGRIYPFVGIRADAKELFRQISKNVENRVSLFKTNTEKDMLTKLSESDIIINAIGYSTKEVKILNMKNSNLEFKAGEKGDEAFNVTKTMALILKKENISFENIFGIGQGYSLHAPEIVNNKRLRADSVHLYNSTVSKRLFKGLEMFIRNNNVTYTSNGGLFGSISGFASNIFSKKVNANLFGTNNNLNNCNNVNNNPIGTGVSGIQCLNQGSTKNLVSKSDLNASNTVNNINSKFKNSESRSNLVSNNNNIITTEKKTNITSTNNNINATASNNIDLNNFIPKYFCNSPLNTNNITKFKLLNANNNQKFANTINNKFNKKNSSVVNARNNSKPSNTKITFIKNAHIENKMEKNNNNNNNTNIKDKVTIKQEEINLSSNNERSKINNNNSNAQDKDKDENFVYNKKKIKLKTNNKKLQSDIKVMDNNNNNNNADNNQKPNISIVKRKHKIKKINKSIDINNNTNNNTNTNNTNITKSSKEYESLKFNKNIKGVSSTQTNFNKRHYSINDTNNKKDINSIIESMIETSNLSMNDNEVKRTSRIERGVITKDYRDVKENKERGNNSKIKHINNLQEDEQTKLYPNYNNINLVKCKNDASAKQVNSTNTATINNTTNKNHNILNNSLNNKIVKNNIVNNIINNNNNTIVNKKAFKSGININNNPESSSIRITNTDTNNNNNNYNSSVNNRELKKNNAVNNSNSNKISNKEEIKQNNRNNNTSNANNVSNKNIRAKKSINKAKVPKESFNTSLLNSNNPKANNLNTSYNVSKNLNCNNKTLNKSISKANTVNLQNEDVYSNTKLDYDMSTKEKENFNDNNNIMLLNTLNNITLTKVYSSDLDIINNKLNRKNKEALNNEKDIENHDNLGNYRNYNSNNSANNYIKTAVNPLALINLVKDNNYSKNKKKYLSSNKVNNKVGNNNTNNLNDNKIPYYKRNNNNMKNTTNKNYSDNESCTNKPKITEILLPKLV